METIIKRAIEGGWKEHFGDKDIRMVWNDKTGWWYEWDSEDEDGNFITLQNPCCYDHIKYQYPLVLNSNFWQSLGKACGWGEVTYKSKRKCEECHGWGYSVGEDGEEYDCYTCGNTGKEDVEKTVKTRYKPDWKTNALRFQEINLIEGWDEAVKWLNEIVCK